MSQRPAFMYTNNNELWNLVYLLLFRALERGCYLGEAAILASGLAEVTSLPAIVCALRAHFSAFFLAERTKIKHHHQNERNNPPAPRF